MSFTAKQELSVISQIEGGRKPSQVRIPSKSPKQIWHLISDLRKAGRLQGYTYKPWTKEEERSLMYQLKKKKKKVKDVKIFGRTYQAIRGHIGKLRRRGEKLNTKGTWSKYADKQLVKQIRAGIPPKDVKIANRSRQAIRARLQKLREYGRVKRRFRKSLNHRRWTDSEMKKLHQFARQKGGKITPRMVMESGILPDRGVGGIRRQLILEKLYFPKTLKAKGKKLSTEERAILKVKLEGEMRYWPSILVAQRLSREPDLIGRYRRRWGLTLVHKEAMRDPVYRAWFLTSSKKRLIAVEANRYPKARVKREVLHLRFDSDARAHMPKSLRQCQECETSWFFCSKYFHVVKRRGKKPALINVCLACPVKKKTP